MLLLTAVEQRRGPGVDPCAPIQSMTANNFSRNFVWDVSVVLVEWLMSAAQRIGTTNVVLLMIKLSKCANSSFRRRNDRRCVACDGGYCIRKHQDKTLIVILLINDLSPRKSTCPWFFVVWEICKALSVRSSLLLLTYRFHNLMGWTNKVSLWNTLLWNYRAILPPKSLAHSLITIPDSTIF